MIPQKRGGRPPPNDEILKAEFPPQEFSLPAAGRALAFHWGPQEEMTSYFSEMALSYHLKPHLQKHLS